MRSRLVVLLCVAVLACAGCGSDVRGSASELMPIGAGLKGPAGTAATVYATGLKNVSAFAFDSRGRLWVATSGATKHDEDGVYLVAKSGSKPVKMIAGLKAPLGLVWHGGRLYVSSLGQVDAYGGLRGTRFADRRRSSTVRSLAERTTTSCWRRAVAW
jgi:hypothetical protein